ncbi:dipeptidase [Microbispora rosea subsp. aerata]|nr:dipeptidase [Microbispora rosea]GGO10690.1 dipeptidase [Microbispora rosea subsp. aerata]GIH53672.1 dipeptidase [Microbispora rosea subsp. aerata]GLJ81665.1 dipeptidase [Microbispora rosea subsp. aerata]
MSDDLRTAVTRLMPRAKADLTELVSYRSVADARQFPPEECRKAADWVAGAFGEAGLTDVALHETVDGSTTVIARHPAPPGAPTVLLYCHYDVQPPLDDDAWQTPVWELTEKDGRWYGRGAADCKGNIVMHLTALRALRALGHDLPVGVTLVAEGSEEQGSAGLQAFVPENAELLRADAVVIADTGNFEVGVPTFTDTMRGGVNVVVTVSTLKAAVHSGSFGGAAPDALAALIHMLATLRDDKGNTTIRGLPGDQTWSGVDYPAEQFRKDAGVLDGVRLIGDGSPADMVWARPAITVIGLDAPPVVGSAAAIQPSARARLNLRFPPGITPDAALRALTEHLEAAAPWGAKVTVELEAAGSAFRSAAGGPARTALSAALREAYGREPIAQGSGASIPLCNVLAETYPEAEIMLIGVEDPESRIHAPNESVDPAEIEHLAFAEALFLTSYGRSSNR